jgi:Flp pilus assembly protein TadD
MDDARIATLRRMAEQHPRDPRPRFGLALEYERRAQWAEAAAELRAYLELAKDEGNAYGRLGHALRELGDDDGAREAYRQGIEAAYRHAHPTMAMEFEEILESWD